MKQADVIWLAGFFDGEGCISVRKSKRGNFQPCITITQKDPRPLEWIATQLGVGKVIYPIRLTSSGNARSPYYRINRKEHIAGFIEMILPYVKLEHRQVKLDKVLRQLKEAKA